MTGCGALPCSHLPLIDAPYTAEVLCAGTSSTQAAKATVLLSVNFKSCGFYGGSAPPLAYQGLKSPSKPLHPHIQFKNFILKTCIQRQAYQAFFHSRQDNIQCALYSAQSVNISQPISNCFRLNYLLLKQQLRHRLPIRPYP